MIHPISNPRNQHGIALVMALVFLMLLTILGVTSMSTSSLEEKMAGNARDRHMAFQAAETALAMGEAWIEGLVADPATWPESDKGKYNPVMGGAIPNWEAIDWTAPDVLIAYPCNPDDADPDDADSCVGGARTLLTGVATQPKYIVERMGTIQVGPPSRVTYRITARGTGGTNAAVVMLQSTYVKEFP